MKDAAKKFRKTCEKCNKPFSAASEEETLCRECRMREDCAKRRAEDVAKRLRLAPASTVVRNSSSRTVSTTSLRSAAILCRPAAPTAAVCTATL